MIPTLRAAALSPDGKRLATGHVGGKFHLWDVSGESPREIASFSKTDSAVAQLVFTPDGQGLLAVIHREVVLWDVSRPVPAIRSHLSEIPTASALAVSPDGKTVVAAGIDRYVTLLGLEGSVLRELIPSRGHRGVIASIELSQDGKTLVSSGAEEKVRVWAFDGKTFVQEAETRAYLNFPAVVTPDGDYLVADPAVFERNHAGLTAVKRVGPPRCLSADGKTLVVDPQQGFLRVMNMSGSTTNERLRVPLPSVGLMFAKLNPDGTALAAYTPSVGHIIWWDLREEKPQMKQLPCDVRLGNLAWAPGHLDTRWQDSHCDACRWLDYLGLEPEPTTRTPSPRTQSRQHFRPGDRTGRPDLRDRV